MQITRFVLPVLAGLLLPSAATAQRVSADIAIGDGPVSGRIIVGDPYPHYYHHPRPVYREVIVIRGHRGYGWYRNHGYRATRIYFDSGRGRYYDRPYFGGLRAVAVFERDGRYYRCDDGYGYGRDDYRRGDYRRDDYRRNDYYDRVYRGHDRDYDRD
jgi:hypothetical protein